MKLTHHDLARMIDLSAVRADSSETDIREMADCAKKHHCIAVFTLPSQTPLIKELLADTPEVHIGGVVGFPDGGQTTQTKVAEAKELVQMGCAELDMVINIGMLRSNQAQYIEDDIRHVVEAANGLPVKVILECHYLSDEEIRTGCELSIAAGAAFIKSGTGWTATGATPENINLMTSCAAGRINVKAAGGIRDLDTLIELYRCGARRFGVGAKSAALIFDQCAQLPNGVVEL